MRAGKLHEEEVNKFSLVDFDAIPPDVFGIGGASVGKDQQVIAVEVILSSPPQGVHFCLLLHHLVYDPLGISLSRGRAGTSGFHFEKQKSTLSVAIEDVDDQVDILPVEARSDAVQFGMIPHPADEGRVLAGDIWARHLPVPNRIRAL